MKVGVPKEVKNREYRVALTPIGVHELVQHGHEVVVQKTAGEGSQIPDEEYVAAGATMLDTADDVWGSADMILKVKEPVAEEYHRMREGQTLFTYLHLAADKPLTEELMARKVTAIAYETVQLPSGGLPLLYPMSEVAGCLAPQVGALLPDEGQRRPRRPDGRRRRRGQRQGRHHRRRRLGPERRQHRARHGRRRHAARHRPRQAADVVLALQQPGPRPRLLQARDRAAGDGGRHGDRRRADPGRRGAQAGHQRPGLADEAGLGARRHRRSTRAAASRTPTPPRTTTRPTRSTTRSSTAWPTCPARCPTPRRTPSPTRRCPTPWRWPTRAGQQALRDDHSLALGLNTHAGQLTNGPVGDAVGIESVGLDTVLA